MRRLESNGVIALVDMSSLNARAIDIRFPDVLATGLEMLSLPAVTSDSADADLHSPTALGWQSRDAAQTVIIHVENSADGRVFSLPAQMRRENLYRHIYAAGALIPDQLGMAFRCGFDAVLVDDERWERYGSVHWESALAQSSSVSYAHSSSTRGSIWQSCGKAGSRSGHPGT